MSEQFQAFEEFVIKKFSSFSEFAAEANETGKFLIEEGGAYLQGQGTIHLTIKQAEQFFKDTYHFILLNNRLYAVVIKEDRGNREKIFDGLYHYHEDILKTSDMQMAMRRSHSLRYRAFNANVHVECKSYEYADEHKIHISKFNKVDLLYSWQLLFHGEKPGADAQFTLNVSPNLKTVVEWQQKMDEVNRKTEALLAQKRKAG